MEENKDQQEMSKKIVISESGNIGFLRTTPKVGMKMEFNTKNNKPDPIKEELVVHSDNERWEYWQKNVNKKSVMREIRKNRIK